MENENTTIKPSDSEGVRYSDLLALIKEEIMRNYGKAIELDRMKMCLDKTTENVSEHRRLSIKAGVYRSCAHDLLNSLKIFLS